MTSLPSVHDDTEVAAPVSDSEGSVRRVLVLVDSEQAVSRWREYESDLQPQNALDIVALPPNEKCDSAWLTGRGADVVVVALEPGDVVNDILRTCQRHRIPTIYRVDRRVRTRCSTRRAEKQFRRTVRSCAAFLVSGF